MPLETSMKIIEVDNLEFSWSKSSEPSLKLPGFNVNKGEKVFISGPSGSGKSTLLSLLTGINIVDSNSGKGTVRILGTDIASLTNSQRDLFRADHIGYIFQQFNLIPYLTVIENVLLPCSFSKKRAANTQDGLIADAMHLLNKLKLPTEYFDQPVTQLSIGQQQRVAVARALIGNPELIIADEPSSALDKRNSILLMDLLISECEKREATLLFVSHDETLQTYFDTTYALDELNQSKELAL